MRSEPTPLLRPVRPDDRAALACFLLALSPASRGLRFHGGVNPRSERLLDQLSQADGRRHIAWVATLPADGTERIVGEARCVGQKGAADMAIAVADDWQGRGLAGPLLQALQAAAREAGVRRLRADVLHRNQRMAAFLRREGFAPEGEAEGERDGDTEAACWVCTLPAPAARSWRSAWWHGLGLGWLRVADGALQRA
jgi:acetyltransferase